ncbi:hypothetical protein B0F90DRAFT_1667620 [Multifurca ochricompacta]|uniref:Uncharacterized protein n=1 Tax=Multifurca ochricompacta TaxID=376703 RepID=A0AAD4M643_9AGAM|nr:hypothetical protein B0F90DRAFT_1667620 [Multifurca ochricompacta]
MTSKARDLPPHMTADTSPSKRFSDHQGNDRQYRGQGQGQDRGQGRETKVTKGDNQGHEQDQNLVGEGARVLTRDRGPALLQGLALGLAPGHGHDRSPGQSRAIREAFTENAHARLALEARPRVAAGVAVGNASGEEREVAKESCPSRGRKEKEGKMGWHRLRWATSGANTGSLYLFQRTRISCLAVEERKMNPERMSKDHNKKEFARFVEDYNTAATKYCSYFAPRKVLQYRDYERRMNAMRAGEFVPPAEDVYDADADMRAHQNNLKRPAVESESYLDKEQLQELRRVQRERVEAGKMKLLGMDIKANMGVRMDGPVLDG